MRLICDVLNWIDTARTINRPADWPLPAPPFCGALPGEGGRVGLAVESMSRHMTDEGWQLFNGIQYGGYILAGKDLYIGTTDVPEALRCAAQITGLETRTLLLQDKREWEGLTADRNRDPSMRFLRVEYLKDRPDIFKGTVIKDAQHNADYHAQSAEEIDAHFWVTPYHPEIVCRLAPYVRREHVVRTYHTIDAHEAPKYRAEGRRGTIISGAVSGAYPLRKRLIENARDLPDCYVKPHPGYHRRGSESAAFLQELSGYKVAICTSSIYGYALRKIIEATAAGCAVITDLPGDEILPLIDTNLYRVHPSVSVDEVAKLARRLIAEYSPERQEHYAMRAKCYYDFRVRGKALAEDIESLRHRYNDPAPMETVNADDGQLRV